MKLRFLLLMRLFIDYISHRCRVVHDDLDITMQFDSPTWWIRTFTLRIVLKLLLSMQLYRRARWTHIGHVPDGCTDAYCRRKLWHPHIRRMTGCWGLSGERYCMYLFSNPYTVYHKWSQFGRIQYLYGEIDLRKRLEVMYELWTVQWPLVDGGYLILTIQNACFLDFLERYFYK